MSFKTRFVIEVLSETEGVDNMGLSEVLEESDTGGFVLSVKEAWTEEVDADEMCTLLLNAGSDPAFFGIGEDEDDDDDEDDADDEDGGDGRK